MWKSALVVIVLTMVLGNTGYAQKMDNSSVVSISYAEMGSVR